ncbi:MAG: LVIVD repeat-containing protein [Burkholderiales bacterium]
MKTACCAAFAALAFAMPLAQAQHGASAQSMALLAHHDLQGRSAYQPVIKQSHGRWIAYVGHHGGKTLNTLTGREEDNGTSIVDVSDPRKPRYLAHIPGEPGQAEQGGAQMVRVCNGSELPKADKSKVYLLRNYGNRAHEVWDVTTPEKPARVVVVIEQLKDTHKSWWECDSGIAYLVSGLGDWRTRRMTQVFDLSDPTQPRFIRNFGLAGQQPGASGPVPTELHGVVSTGPKGNRVYFGYGTNKAGVVQIVDREKLITGAPEPTPQNLLAPQVGRFDLNANNGAHTTLPVLGMQVAEFAKDKDGGKRNIIVVVDESLANECTEPRQMVWMLDATDEKRPVSIATYTVPESSGNFCSRGGRFGSHSSNENQPPMYYGKYVFVAWFNAGVRALDISDPYHPREAGYYVPATTDKTDKRCIKDASGAERCKVAIQTNNLEVDDRGYIYAVDRANTGLHILEFQRP